MAKAPLDRLSQLDALRGIACLMVLLAHLKAVRPFSRIPDVVGVAGVGVFFALSGFLITRILLADRDGGLAGFYNRRAARIFPIYYLTLFVLALSWPGKELGWAATFTFNFRFLAAPLNYFQTVDPQYAVPPVAHFWSLCVEEHFYWIWPLIVCLLPFRLVRWIPLAVIAATPIVSYWIAEQLSLSGFSAPEIDGLISRMTLTQLPAICIGALAACHEDWLRASTRRTAILGCALVAIGFVWPPLSRHLSAEMTRSAFTTVLHVVCGGAFLIVLALPLIGRWKTLRNIGTVSYGLYLYHLPIYAQLGLADAQHGSTLLKGAFALALTTLAAVISYRFFESPILRLARRPLQGRLSLLRYAGTLASAGVAAAFVLNLCLAKDEIDSQLVAIAAESKTLPKEQIQSIILGSSHGEMGIASAEFDEVTYNLASPSQDFWYDNLIVNQAVETLPNLKRAVFCISAFSFRRALCDTAETFRETIYRKTWGFPSRKKEQRRLIALRQSIPLESFQMMLAKSLFKDDANRGWNPLTPQPVNYESATAAAARHGASGPERIQENVELLTAAIQRCQASGIACVLISTPTLSAYRAELPAELRLETARWTKSVAEACQVPYLDYSADTRFGESDFYDCDHLNRDGAVKFTRLLVHDLRGSTPNVETARAREMTPASR